MLNVRPARGFNFINILKIVSPQNRLLTGVKFYLKVSREKREKFKISIVVSSCSKLAYLVSSFGDLLKL